MVKTVYERNYTVLRGVCQKNEQMTKTGGSKRIRKDLRKIYKTPQNLGYSD